MSPGGVRGVWLRHSLETRALRLRRLERWSAESGKVLTESQVVALEAAKEEKQSHGEIERREEGHEGPSQFPLPTPFNPTNQFPLRGNNDKPPAKSPINKGNRMLRGWTQF